MPTIPLSRPLIHGQNMGETPPYFPFPIKASLTSIVPGASIMPEGGATGYILVDNTDPAEVLGFSEFTVGAVALAEGTLVPVSLVMPHTVVEMSVTGTGAITLLHSAKRINAADETTYAIFDSTAGNGVIIPFAPASNADVFSVKAYKNANSTTINAGQSMSPLGGMLGVIGDTNTRFLCHIAAGKCALVA